MSKFKKGFTLIEIAIALVVVGLIISGIIAGSSILDSFKVTSEISKVKEFRSAVNAFKDKYDDLPGDFDEATDYFDSFSGLADGNGDGKILTDTIGSSNTLEVGYAWRHLEHSQILNIDVKNSNPGNRYDCNGGNTGIPAFEEAGCYFLVNEFKEIYSTYSGGTYSPSQNYPTTYTPGNDLFLRISGFRDFDETTIKQEWAEKMDLKLDDGEPDTGKVLSTNNTHSGTTGCVDAARTSTSGANWLRQEDGGGTCIIYFLFN